VAKAEKEAAAVKAAEEATAARAAKVEAAAEAAKETAAAKAAEEVAAAKAAASKAAASTAVVLIPHRLPSSPRVVLPFMYLQGVVEGLDQAEGAALLEMSPRNGEKTSWELAEEGLPAPSDCEARKAAWSPRAVSSRRQPYESPRTCKSPRVYESPRTCKSPRVYESPHTYESFYESRPPAMRSRRPTHELPSAVRLRRISSEQLLPPARLSSPGQLITVRKLRFDQQPNSQLWALQQPLGHAVLGAHTMSTSGRPGSAALPRVEGRGAPSRYYPEKTSWELMDGVPPSDLEVRTTALSPRAVTSQSPRAVTSQSSALTRGRLSNSLNML